jgi:hypothetical protein
MFKNDRKIIVRRFLNIDDGTFLDLKMCHCELTIAYFHINKMPSLMLENDHKIIVQRFLNIDDATFLDVKMCHCELMITYFHTKKSATADVRK